MDSANTAHPLRLQTWLSVLTLVVGVVLMARQMYADDEPGAIPLLVVAVGVGWLVVTRARGRGARNTGTARNRRTDAGGSV